MRNLYEIILSELGEDNVLLGGSRRFGYNSKYSDYDIFVLDNEQNDFKSWLREAEAKRDYTTIPYETDSERWTLGNADIHVYDAFQSIAFNHLKTEHAEVEQYIADNNLLPGLKLAMGALRGNQRAHQPSVASRIFRTILLATVQERCAREDAERAERYKVAYWMEKLTPEQRAYYAHTGVQNKVLAIKEMREQFGRSEAQVDGFVPYAMGLKEAKETVEHLMRTHEALFDFARAFNQALERNNAVS